MIFFIEQVYISKSYSSCRKFFKRREKKLDCFFDFWLEYRPTQIRRLEVIRNRIGANFDYPLTVRFVEFEDRLVLRIAILLADRGGNV